jgi:hypothetical protein
MSRPSLANISSIWPARIAERAHDALVVVSHDDVEVDVDPDPGQDRGDLLGVGVGYLPEQELGPDADYLSVQRPPPDAR